MVAVMASRLHKSLDALSQWCNVTFLRRHYDTDSDESMSGRCYWEAEHGSKHWTWKAAQRFIDTLLWFDRDDQGRGHCELADLKDYERAKEKVRRFEGRQ